MQYEAEGERSARVDHIDTMASLKQRVAALSGIKERIALIAEYAKEATGADRCSVFVFHKEKDQLRSIYADGIHGTIALRSNAGIVGYTFHKKESVLENNTETSSIFLKAVDKKSGYQTKTILAVPIIDASDKRLGVIQLLNKEEGFTETDKKNVEALAELAVLVLKPDEEKLHEELPVQSQEEIEKEALQKKLDAYLADKKLFFMDDGNVYYKILNMPADYYIGADKCYLLDENPKKVALYHYTSSNDFVPTEMLVKIDERTDSLLVSMRVNNEDFVRYPLERD